MKLTIPKLRKTIRAVIKETYKNSSGRPSQELSGLQGLKDWIEMNEDMGQPEEYLGTIESYVEAVNDDNTVPNTTFNQVRNDLEELLKRGEGVEDNGLVVLAM